MKIKFSPGMLQSYRTTEWMYSDNQRVAQT